MGKKVDGRTGRKAFLGTALAVLGIILAAAAFWLYVRTSYRQVANDNVICYDTKGNFLELSEGELFTQDFCCSMDTLTGITLFLAPGAGNGPAEGQFWVRLWDPEAGELLLEQAYQAGEIRDVPLDLSLAAPLERKKGRLLRVSLELMGTGSAPVYVRLSEPGRYEEAVFYANGIEQEADLGLTLWGIRSTGPLLGVAAFAYLLLLVLLLGLYFLLFWKKCCLEKCFLLCGALLGLIYLLIIPAGNPSDELRHFTRAYRISDFMLGQGGKDQSRVYVRKQDAEFYLGNNWLGDTIDRGYAERYFGEFFRRYEDRETALVPARMWAERPVTQYECIRDYRAEVASYLLPAAGITLGRLLGLSLPGLFVCGRLMAWLFYLACIFYAMKKLPFGKEALFVLALLPMTIQQMCSISYDGLAIGLSFLSVSLALHLACGNGGRKGEIALLVVTQLVLLPMKHFGLAPILLLDLLPLYRWQKKRGRSFWTSKRHRLLAGGLIALGAAGAVLLAGKVVLGAGGGGVSEALALLGQPGKLLLVLFNTLFFSGHWADNFVGIFINTELPGIILYPYFLLLAAACIRPEGEGVLLERRERLVLGAAALGTAGLAVLGIFLCWSGGQELYIAGVQGRYFIPGALAGMLALRSKRCSLPEAGMRRVLFFTAGMQLLAVTGIFLQFR